MKPDMLEEVVWMEIISSWDIKTRFNKDSTIIKRKRWMKMKGDESKSYTVKSAYKILSNNICGEEHSNLENMCNSKC